MSDNKQCTNCIRKLTSDKPTKLSNLGFRVLYTAAGWWWLGYGVSEGSTFFVSLGLFILPLLIDYISFSPPEKMRKYLKGFQITLCVISLLLAYLGSIHSIDIIKEANTLYIIPDKNHLLLMDLDFKFKLSLAYMFHIIYVAFAFIDWVSAPRQHEFKYKEAFNNSL